MNRRQMLLGSGAMMISSLIADPHAAHAAGGAALADAAAACITAGDACLDHCLTLLGKGDTSLAACARSVADMLAVNAALLRLAGLRSTHLAGMARVAIEVDGACEVECRKHAETHPPCKGCADACALTVAAVKAALPQ